MSLASSLGHACPVVICMLFGLEALAVVTGDVPQLNCLVALYRTHSGLKAGRNEDSPAGLHSVSCCSCWLFSWFVLFQFDYVLQKLFVLLANSCNIWVPQSNFILSAAGWKWTSSQSGAFVHFSVLFTKIVRLLSRSQNISLEERVFLCFLAVCCNRQVWFMPVLIFFAGFAIIFHFISGNSTLNSICFMSEQVLYLKVLVHAEVLLRQALCAKMPCLQNDGGIECYVNNCLSTMGHTCVLWVLQY